MPRFDTPITASDQALERVLNAGFPVALVIWRDMLDESLSAALREVARADAGRLLITKMDASENPQIAARASGPLPALLLFRDGAEVGRAQGLTAATFRAHVAHLLGRGPRPADRAPLSSSARAGAPVTVSDATFQREVLESSLPVLVDLWAPWCGPCHMIAPIVEKLARDYEGRLKVAKLNVDENPQTAMRYQVQSIPTLLLFKSGRVADRIVGAAPEPLLRGKVDAALRG
ncbi:MAG: thioredoxin [Anaerolineae bacterium]|nr:thioredoxin [Anaerolineae bacterium]